MIFIDTEFNNVSEKYVTPICLSFYNNRSTEKGNFWVFKDEEETKRCREFILNNRYSTFSSYSVEAEARFLLAIGVDPRQFDWVDLYLEYLMINNHNDKLNLGNHLTSSGKIINIFPTYKADRFKPGKQKRDSISNKHIPSGLASACFKLLNITIDTDHKHKMRDIIISGNELDILSNKKDILKYCDSDTEHLNSLFHAIKDNYPVCPEPSEMSLRGRYSVETAYLTTTGYPVNVEILRALPAKTDMILNKARELANVDSGLPLFEKQKDGSFRQNVKFTKEWIGENLSEIKWTRTINDGISLSHDALNKFRDVHPAIEILYQFSKLKKSFSGFIPKKNKKPFAFINPDTGEEEEGNTSSLFEHLGSDGRIRPRAAHYASQSSRTQYKSTEFIFLKSKFLRGLVEPKAGRAIAGIDYSSQEFLLSALISGDDNMLDAYKSGDVYSAFAIDSAQVECQGSTMEEKIKYLKQNFIHVRPANKAMILGLSYQMGVESLGRRLCEVYKKNPTYQEMNEAELLEFSTLEAKRLSALFHATYNKFTNWRENFTREYECCEFVKLPCGWYMYGDNYNEKSVGNCPIQGVGATIMREAVTQAHAQGLEVIFTLHDAIYIEYNSFDFSKIDLLNKVMRDAVIKYFPNGGENIRMDCSTWSKEYKHDEYLSTPNGWKIHTQRIYIDENAEREFNKFAEDVWGLPSEELKNPTWSLL